MVLFDYPWPDGSDKTAIDDFLGVAQAVGETMCKDESLIVRTRGKIFLKTIELSRRQHTELNKFAAWGEGQTVNGTFDCPAHATAARDTVQECIAIVKEFK